MLKVPAQDEKEHGRKSQRDAVLALKLLLRDLIWQLKEEATTEIHSAVSHYLQVPLPLRVVA